MAAAPELGNHEIGELNALQIRLAEVLGWSDLRGIVFENGNSAAMEAAGVLRSIDGLIGSATELIFSDGIEAIRRLFLTDIPATLRVVETTRSSVPVQSPPPPVTQSSKDALFSVVTEAPAGSLILMEASERGLSDEFFSIKTRNPSNSK